MDLQLYLNERLRAIPFRVTNSSPGTSESKPTTELSLPKCALQRFEQFNLELIRIGLVQVGDSSTISQLIRKLQRFKISMNTLKKCSGPCKYCNYGLTINVHGLASDLEKRFEGFCLECAQSSEWRVCDNCEAIY